MQNFPEIWLQRINKYSGLLNLKIHPLPKSLKLLVTRENVVQKRSISWIPQNILLSLLLIFEKSFCFVLCAVLTSGNCELARALTKNALTGILFPLLRAPAWPLLSPHSSLLTTVWDVTVDDWFREQKKWKDLLLTCALALLSSHADPWRWKLTSLLFTVT